MFPAGLPVRGRRVVIALPESMDMSAAMARAKTLKNELPSDMHVFASPGRSDQGPTLTVMQLVTEAEAAEIRSALDRLVAEFRSLASTLVAQLPMSYADFPATVSARDTMWTVDPHGEHCRFEDSVSGEVVEANLYQPDAVDPYFLLLFAETSGRHNAVLETCVEGFHDMCRLLDLS